MRRESILMIWVGGAVLAVALYLVGPDRFLDACLDLFDRVDAVFHNLALVLGAQAYSMIRAAAIAVYAVFAVLSFLASRRGQHGFWALIVVSALVLALVWRPYLGSAPISHWFLALVLALAGAVMMTQRLTTPRPVRPGPPPYPMGRVP